MKTKSFKQVLEESSPAVKRAYRKEVKKLAVKKVTKKKVVTKELSKRERIAKDNATYKAEHEQYLKDVASCEHICSGNCRRNGCNCNCGEYHQAPTFKVTKTTGLPKKCKNCDPKPNKVIRTNENSQCIDCGRQVGGVRTNRFADKDFSRFAPENTTTHLTRSVIDKAKTTAFLGEIEGEPAINCDKWTAMCVVLVLLCVVAYAMHGDYQALQSNLIH